VAGDLNGQVGRERRQRREVPLRHHDCQCHRHTMRSETRPTEGSFGGMMELQHVDSGELEG
jgi:hypothetical protein